MNGDDVYENNLIRLNLQLMKIKSTYAVDKWRHYLQYKHFVVRTDHHSLKYLLEQKVTSAIQHKVLTKFLGLDYEIQYKRGAENRVADALSR